MNTIWSHKSPLPHRVFAAAGVVEPLVVMMHATERSRHSDELLGALEGFSQVVVVMHDYPDPDAIASGWALHKLLQKRASIPCRLVGGGSIVRGENLELVRLLQPPVELISFLAIEHGMATILIDCSPNAQNHLLARVPTLPTANIDHHHTNTGKLDIPFSDLRASAAATVSIAASYMQEQGVEPGEALATAMLYAIRTETQGHETQFSTLDRLMLTWITERADPGKVAEIENAPLSRAYFSDLLLGLQGTLLYENSALCMLPQAAGPETVAEVADLLSRCKGVARVMCAAPVGHHIIVSFRTAPDGGDAAGLAQETLDGVGHSGGHEHRAGGKITDAAEKGHISVKHQRELRRRWLAACEVASSHGVRLVSKRAILANL